MLHIALKLACNQQLTAAARILGALRETFKAHGLRFNHLHRHFEQRVMEILSAQLETTQIQREFMAGLAYSDLPIFTFALSELEKLSC